MRQRTKNVQILLLCGLGVLTMASTTGADLIAYEPFDYEDDSVVLVGKPGGAGLGEWSPWSFSNQPLNLEIAKGSLDVREAPSQNFLSLDTAGNHVTTKDVLIGNDWVGLWSQLESQVGRDETVTRFLSFLLRPEGIVGEGSFGGLVGLALQGSRSALMIGKPDVSDDYALYTFPLRNVHLSDISAVSGELSLFVIKAELRPGEDSFTMFINPEPGELEPAIGVTKDDLDLGAVTGIAIAAAGKVSLDEIRWGETFADVTPLAGPVLQPGDADQDFDFDQLDLVQVQVAAKYLTGQPATWGEGDWNGAPGGAPGNPPLGNGFFDQLDIISALGAGAYLTGSYAAILRDGNVADGQTSIIYNPNTGELGADAPAGVELTSINIDSAAGIFTGQSAQNLGGSFDNDADDNIFKATFGGSFGSLSFGNVAQNGLSEDFVANDLTVVGSLAGGGDLGPVDLIYVPEPSTIALLVMGIVGTLNWSRRRR